MTSGTATQAIARRRNSGAGLLGVPLDPLVAVGTLLVCMTYFEVTLSPPYLVLAALAFGLTLPHSAAPYSGLAHMARTAGVKWLAAISALGLVGIVTGYLSYFPQELLLAWVLLTPVTGAAGHLLLNRWLPDLLARASPRSVVVVGVNQAGLRLLEQLRSHPYTASRLVGLFDDRNPERLQLPPGGQLLGKVEDLADYVKQRRVDAIYLALPMATQPRVLAVLDALKDTTASIYFVPDMSVTDTIQGGIDQIGDVPVVSVCDSPFTGFRGTIKRGSDIVLASVILILASPLLLALAAGVRLSSPGPVIFKQRRYGLDGREILVYKFRSMRTCDDGEEIRQASRDDPRITPFGSFLRKTSMDELPQLINVLQGRMSLVGPRPHAVAHNDMYRKLIKGYMLRHKARPGITGWAQIHGFRGETQSVEDMQKRIECDLEYLRTWSLGLDLWIMAKTAAVILKQQNAY